MLTFIYACIYPRRAVNYNATPFLWKVITAKWKSHPQSWGRALFWWLWRWKATTEKIVVGLSRKILSANIWTRILSLKNIIYSSLSLAIVAISRSNDTLLSMMTFWWDMTTNNQSKRQHQLVIFMRTIKPGKMQKYKTRGPSKSTLGN